MNRLICIAGPTASGKTALSIALAQELDGEIVSCDSMQVYRRMDIGTAKPTVAERCGIVHHMLDVAEPDEDFSVSRYCNMASPIIDDILARGRTAIVVGGTGLYMDNLIRGTEFAPFPSTGVRQQLEALPIEEVQQRLRQVDPQSADRLPISDKKRIIRALEIYLETGQTMTEHDRISREKPDKYKPLWFALTDEDRQTLYDRIDYRVDLMLEQGLLDEIRSLLTSGIPAKCTAMQAIGYKEFVDALDGKCTVEEAAALVKQSSRRYAKRQLTWFRRNPAIHWIIRQKNSSPEEIFTRIRQISREFDKSHLL